MPEDQRDFIENGGEIGEFSGKAGLPAEALVGRLSRDEARAGGDAPPPRLAAAV
jgi:hypothetical protein